MFVGGKRLFDRICSKCNCKLRFVGFASAHTLFCLEMTLFGRKKIPCGNYDAAKPRFQEKTHFWGGQKAPAGTARRQHPGFNRKRTLCAKKKPLRELRRRNTLVLRENALLVLQKAPAGTATPQHPGFNRRTNFRSEKKKSLRELRRRNTLLSKENTLWGRKKVPVETATPQHSGFERKHTLVRTKKSPCWNWDAATPWF